MPPPWIARAASAAIASGAVMRGANATAPSTIPAVQPAITSE